MPPKASTTWVSSHFILAGLLILSGLVFLNIQKAASSVSVLDVGQGDAILIRTPQFKNILIDAGPDGAVIDRLGEELGFFDKTIDLFILTHPNLDHIGGALDV